MQSKIEDGMERSKEMAKMIEDVEEDDEVSERDDHAPGCDAHR